MKLFHQKPVLLKQSGTDTENEVTPLGQYK